MSSINYKKYFEGKKITKQGFGVLGRGYGVVKFLLESGAKVLVTDMKPADFFKDQIQDLQNFCRENDVNFENVNFIFGEHRLKDFENCDYVVAASGVPKDNIYINHAKQKNIPVYQESSLFAEIVRDFNNQILETSKEENVLENLSTIKIVGITGTRGKTTTTFLIKAILDAYIADLNKKDSTDIKVYFGGNVQGVATLENLKQIKSGDYVVMELDSWVLQGFGDIKFSPNISVFTTFMPDHMNYYKGSMQDYFDDKANIFKFQKSSDYFISGEKTLNIISEYNKLETKSTLLKIHPTDILDTTFNLYGKSNIYYALLAKKVGEILGVSEELIYKTISEFKAVKGRLEKVATGKNGEIYINDTTATTPEATIYALKALRDSFGDVKKVTLIFGGRDKELDFTNLLTTIKSFQDSGFLKRTILLKDETTTGSNRLMENLDLDLELESAENLEKALEVATDNVTEDDIILFSPGFASFGMFQNEYDRGDRFTLTIQRFI